MDKNAKVNRVQVLRRKQAKHVAALAEIEAELCPLLCDLLNEHGPGAGIDGEVMAAATEPKDGGKP